MQVKSKYLGVLSQPVLTYILTKAGSNRDNLCHDFKENSKKVPLTYDITINNKVNIENKDASDSVKGN